MSNFRIVDESSLTDPLGPLPGEGKAKVEVHGRTGEKFRIVDESYLQGVKRRAGAGVGLFGKTIAAPFSALGQTLVNLSAEQGGQRTVGKGVQVPMLGAAHMTPEIIAEQGYPPQGIQSRPVGEAVSGGRGLVMTMVDQMGGLGHPVPFGSTYEQEQKLPSGLEFAIQAAEPIVPGAAAIKAIGTPLRYRRLYGGKALDDLYPGTTLPQDVVQVGREGMNELLTLDPLRTQAKVHARRAGVQKQKIGRLLHGEFEGLPKAPIEDITKLVSMDMRKKLEGEAVKRIKKERGIKLPKGQVDEATRQLMKDVYKEARAEIDVTSTEEALLKISSMSKDELTDYIGKVMQIKSNRGFLAYHYIRPATKVFRGLEDRFGAYSKIYVPIATKKARSLEIFQQYEDYFKLQRKKMFGKDPLTDIEENRVTQYMTRRREVTEGKTPSVEPVTLSEREAQLVQLIDEEADMFWRSRQGIEEKLGLKSVPTAEDYFPFIYSQEAAFAGLKDFKLLSGEVVSPSQWAPFYTKMATELSASKVTGKASELWLKRARAQINEIYMHPTLKEVKEISKKYPQDVRRYVDHWTNRMMGIPSSVDVRIAMELNSAWNSVRKMMGKSPAQLPTDYITKWTRTIVDLGYMGALGVPRVWPSARNLFQPSLTTAPDIGLQWLKVGYFRAMDPEFIQWAKQEKFLQKYFVPEMFEQEMSKIPQWMKEFSMYAFKSSDDMNRLATAGAADAKFIWTWKKAGGDKEKFKKMLDLKARDRAAVDDIMHSLEKGNVEEAKKHYINDVLRATQFLYTSEASPVISQVLGSPGKALMQFRTWPPNFAELLFDWATKGSPPKQLVKFMQASGTHAVTYMLMLQMGASKRKARSSTYLGPLQTGTEVSRFNLPMGAGVAYDAAQIIPDAIMIPVDSIHAYILEGDYNAALRAAGKAWDNLEGQTKRTAKSAIPLVPGGLGFKDIYETATDDVAGKSPLQKALSYGGFR